MRILAFSGREAKALFNEDLTRLQAVLARFQEVMFIDINSVGVRPGAAQCDAGAFLGLKSLLPEAKQVGQER
jgi:hypothetical protein